MTTIPIQTCEHLKELEKAIRNAGVIIVTYGDWWGTGNKQNIYFDCVLDQKAIEKEFELAPFVEWYEYDGRVAGSEAGYECKQCSSLLVGKLALYGGEQWPNPSL